MNRKTIAWVLVAFSLFSAFSIYSMYAVLGTNLSPSMFILPIIMLIIAYNLLKPKEDNEADKIEISTKTKIVIYTVETIIVLLVTFLMLLLLWKDNRQSTFDWIFMITVLVMSFIMPPPKEVINYVNRRRESKNTYDNKISTISSPEKKEEFYSEKKAFIIPEYEKADESKSFYDIIIDEEKLDVEQSDMDYNKTKIERNKRDNKFVSFLKKNKFSKRFFNLNTGVYRLLVTISIVLSFIYAFIKADDIYGFEFDFEFIVLFLLFYVLALIYFIIIVRVILWIYDGFIKDKNNKQK